MFRNYIRLNDLHFEMDVRSYLEIRHKEKYFAGSNEEVN